MSVNSTGNNPVSGVEPQQEIYEFPLSPSQSALWFINQLNPQTAAYNIPVCIRMAGKLDQAALQKSLDYIVARHEIFRTCYGSNNVEAIQFVHSEGSCPLHVDDISGLDPDKREDHLQSSLATEVAKPFDLQNGPVLRANLWLLAPEQSCLLLNMHHITVDHSAVGLCIKELEAAYQSFLQGAEPDLPEQALQYADYVIWAKENIQHEQLDEKLKVWSKRLDGFSGVLNLPTDKPRPAISSMNGAQYQFEFSPQTSSAVVDFSKANGVSLYLSLLASFNVLLHRYAQQDDIIVATPFANRGDQEELEAVVGCFINTLPLAINFAKVDHFHSLIAQVKSVMLEAYENQSVPLGSIVETINPVRDQSHNPLFQVGFIFQEPPCELHLHGLDCRTLPLHSSGAMYDLHVWMWESNGQLAVQVWYDTELFSEPSIAKLMEHFHQLTATLVANPQSDVDSLEMVTPSEKQFFERANASACDWPHQSPLPELLTRSAASAGDKLAVVSGGQELSYRELEQRSSQLANYLVSRGVKPNDFVAISLNRSVDLLVGLLGIMKTGAAYVPLDPDYPADRLLYMLEQSAVAVMVTESVLQDSLPDYACDAIRLDSDWDAIAGCAQQAVVGPSVDSLMYVIFTSGSTGLPKGVQVPHAAVVNFLSTMAQQPGFVASDRLLAVTTLSFDIAVLELFLPLLAGATVVLADREQAADGQQLAALLEAQKISVMQATPSTWRLLVAAGWQGTDSFKALCGGEAFPRDLAAELLSRCAEVWNLYGPTETTVWSTRYLIESADAPILIGKPIGNTQCHVVNEQLQLQPVGVAGELYIGGDGVTVGYLGRDDLTAERFVADIFRPDVAGARLYRTGDLVRWRDDGNLEYFDRIDNQVKLRGFRIELEEIEKTLVQLASVAECAVTVKELSALDKRLVAYVKFHPGQHMTSSEVRRHLRNHLPDYMVVQHLVELESLPLTPNGKINRKALPDPFENLAHNQEQHFIEPASEAEKLLARIWIEAIGVDKISADSNFFEVGGHSLLALSVLFQIEQQSGVKLYPRDLLMETLEQLALKLPLPESTASDIAVEATESKAKQKGIFGKILGTFKG